MKDFSTTNLPLLTHLAPSRASPLARASPLSRASPLALVAAFAIIVMAAPLANAGEDHTMVRPGQIEWSAGPASIPAGAQAVVLYGNPAEEGLFALRLKLPAGYHLPPHTHPQPEVVTVISGTFHLGMGKEAVRESAKGLEAGSFFAFPPGMAHYAYTEEETVIQLNSTGPWGLEYVNPADDPRS